MTGEFYTKKEHFPGFARPFVFNAEVLLRLKKDLLKIISPRSFKFLTTCLAFVLKGFFFLWHFIGLVVM